MFRTRLRCDLRATSSHGITSGLHFPIKRSWDKPVHERWKQLGLMPSGRLNRRAIPASRDRRDHPARCRRRPGRGLHAGTSPQNRDRSWIGSSIQLNNSYFCQTSGLTCCGLKGRGQPERVYGTFAPSMGSNCHGPGKPFDEFARRTANAPAVKRPTRLWSGTRSCKRRRVSSTIGQVFVDDG